MPKSTNQDRLFQMRTSTEFLQAIDDWRRQQPEIPSKAEAIRRLIEIGLDAELARTKGKKKDR